MLKEELQNKAATIWEKVKDTTGLGQNAQFVVPHERGWAVRPKGCTNATSVYENKEEAVERAKDLAQRQEAELVIFDQDGNLQRKHSYTN